MGINSIYWLNRGQYWKLDALSLGIFKLRLAYNNKLSLNEMINLILFQFKRVHRLIMSPHFQHKLPFNVIWRAQIKLQKKFASAHI
jgi:hypothetical protein